MSEIVFFVRPGHRFVDDAMADPSVKSFVQAFFEEQTPTLQPVPGVDMAVYKEDLIKRFSNHFIKDTVQRLAEDGSNKLLTTMRDPALANAAAGRPVTLFCFVVATWIRYLCAFDEAGADIEIKDTSPDKVASMTAAAQGIFGVGGASSKVVSFDPVASRARTVDFLREIFGSDIASCQPAVSGVLEMLTALSAQGTRKLMEKLTT